LSKFLVAGGAGFIGSNLVEAILGRGDDAVVLDDFSTGRRENLSAAAEWAAAGGGTFRLVEGDMRDLATCRDVLSGVDFVLHKAAIPSVQRSVQEPLLTNAVNVQGTLNLLESAREAEVKRFVFASSSSLYGESETLPKVESMPSAPISPYGLQKLAGETYCRLYHDLYGLPTIALRYFNVFGPRQNPASDYAAVIPLFIRAGLDGSRATVFGDGEQTRDFTFVHNVIDANMLACKAGPAACGRAYNIACADRISLNNLLQRIGEIVGHEVPADYLEPRAGDIKHSLAGIDLAAEHLNYRPRVDLKQGLRLTIEAF